MSGPRDARPGNRPVSRPDSTGRAGRLARFYGYDHYEVTEDDGTGWSVSRRSPIREGGTFEPTEWPSAQEWEQARRDYEREQLRRLDRQAERLIETHPDLQDLDGDPDDT